MTKTQAVSTFAFLFLASCSGNPRDILNSVIKDKAFIPYELPMPSTRVGTIFRGNAKEMYLVATPEKCFPDPDPAYALRWVQATDLPNEYHHVEFGFDAALNQLLNTGTVTLNLKASATYVKTVEIEFAGASVEFLEEMSFDDYYRNRMPAACQTALLKYPFIGQALRVDKMKIVFKDQAGGSIDLKAKLSEVVDIGVGVKWKIENGSSLIIETPKYIGYRMAQLAPSDDGGYEIQYATTTTDAGAWIFRSVEPMDVQSFVSAARPAEPLR